MFVDMSTFCFFFFDTIDVLIDNYSSGYLGMVVQHCVRAYLGPHCILSSWVDHCTLFKVLL